jgi:hypothetical protein
MMVTLSLKIAEYNYLRRILPWVADELEEFAPWDIDDPKELGRDIEMTKQVMRLLDRVEQEQLFTH